MLSALYLEISAVGVLLLMVILTSRRQETGSSAAQRQFTILIYTAMAMMIVDSACWLIDGKQFPFAHVANYAVETVYFSLHLFLPYIWTIYTEHALSTNEAVLKRNKKWETAVLTLFLVGLIFNLKYGFIFTIDSNNVYHRAFGVLIYAAFAYGLLVYSSVRTLIKAKNTEWVDDKRRYHVMAFFAVPPMIGGIIQLLYYGVNLSWFLATISILQVYIDSQNRQISADPLTGLNNRRELTKYLLRETRERDAAKNGAPSLIMMDVDGFKLINDTYGHFYGDKVLAAVADVLKKSCKNTEAFLARYGGDEFCIVLPGERSTEANELIFRIQLNLKNHNMAHQDHLPIRLSIGHAEWDEKLDTNYESLIGRADQMMYEIKNAKKCA